MKILCPRCERRIKPTQSDGLTGSGGMLIKRLMERSDPHYVCEWCGKIPLDEFPDNVKRWYYIETYLMVVVLLAAIGIVVTITVITAQID